jgi:hypothetical protein
VGSHHLLKHALRRHRGHLAVLDHQNASREYATSRLDAWAPRGRQNSR